MLGGAAALFCYTAGLTFIAAQENLRVVGNLWPVAVLGLPFLYALQWLGASAAASAIFCCLAVWTVYGLSFAVRREGRDVPGAVVRLIAGISLLDAMLIAGHGLAAVALVAACGLPLTRLLQRLVPGT